MKTTWKSKIRYIRPASIMLLGIPAVVWVMMQGYSAAWTGFANPSGEALTVRTLWDWMDLLLVPLFIAAAALLLNRSQQSSERQRAKERLALEQEIENDRQQEEFLQAYFDRIIELVLKDKLSKFSPDEIRNAARTRTLAVLRGLDGRRKGLVILFLRDAGLIDRADAVIDLCGANLREAHLAQASLKRVNLAEADLSHADLSGANLNKSYMSSTNLSNANLHGADISGADLFEANLNGANLTQCNLREAKVSGAKLDGAKFLGANLSQADLSGTQVTDTELEKARSLEGTTMPDGTRHI